MKLANDLTLDEVMGRLDKRFNQTLNLQRHGRPKVPHKTATATITRTEFETLKTELLELRVKAELEDGSFEAIYLKPEDVQ